MIGDESPSVPLAKVFRRLIANTGPISLMHYMGEANARYYDARDPLGSGGDFVTAPEISQMFGELIGLWLTDIWTRAGRPQPVHYVELGPGRGTLARDALRTMKRMGLEPVVHLVEASTALKDLQLAAVPEAQWHADLSSVPLTGPLLIVANEFLDALPVRQLVRTGAGWRERMVVAEGDRFACVAGTQPMDAAVPEARREAEEGTIIETCPGAAAILYEAAGRLVAQGGAALFIDYGHDRLRDGSTLQAVRRHQKVDPFSDPGEADLTAHVDFATAMQIASSRGCKVMGTVPQGRWLRDLGIETRAQALASAAPHQADAILGAMDRLVGDEQMGTLFKVMGLAGPDWPDGAGFSH
ncbi:NADH dehydrogenase [ubiquinone] 1 alpha subcomplex assembly factor 7 [Novosphingobium kunmingense]|uniref:NADH dehydrogenase [ubiquinone] 1 alpha subcomplex assembly factor 7 n=1 Tax=Novosphingobium kunmingense TaxID=1211806 RepID=A0A2N0HK11_9SPHN|nr:SAM-dependent methyltransferase [Novosphingobium kunmingense]PKB19225.1 NADH dehydrogenase [ubiquinone] 1 alpha subcomplex assembly factor 7 [Novosphingobium kunmingense]